MREEVPERKPSILVIDSDSEFADDLSILLSQEYEVSSATDFNAAVETIDKLLPECILIDLKAFLAICESDPMSPFVDRCTGMQIECPPIIVMTPDSPDQKSTILVQTAARIRKPVDINELSKLIKSVIQT